MNLPDAWAERLAGYQWQPQTIGESKADVFRLTAPDWPTLFIKSEPFWPLAELEAEYKALNWLAEKAIPAPVPLSLIVHENRRLMLMTAVRGRDMASVPELPPDLVAQQAAFGLRRLHALDPAACPFRRPQSFMLAEARRHLDAGLLDGIDFDGEYRSVPASTLHAGLTDNPPPEDDLVVCHGDACLPNLLIAETSFSGFVDCARLGVADRHQDLALAIGSISRNLGAAAVPAFIAAYGHELDPRKLDFYRLLDEFF